MVSIQYHNSLNEADRKSINRWLNVVTGALLTVYGDLPKDKIQVTINRSSRRSSPVPWGQVDRGNPVNVLLVVNPEFSYSQWVNDWTAYHEFSHLLLPYRGYGDLWLSEGLATYYQNVIQARGGRFNEKEMWRRIVTGFERGSMDQQWNHASLTEVSDNLGETRQFFRVHWSGVLFWLTADTLLRKKGDDTLDSVLYELKNCCGQRLMSAEEIVLKLDELTGGDMFYSLFRKFKNSYRVPDYRSVLSELGVRNISGNEGIIFDDKAPSANIRQLIYHR